MLRLPKAPSPDEERRQEFIRRINGDKITKMVLSQMPKKAAQRNNRYQQRRFETKKQTNQGRTVANVIYDFVSGMVILKWQEMARVHKFAK